MVLKKIKLENFRNIKNAELEFNSQVNILYGDNAQGKTNLLEAIAIVLGKSFRNIRKTDILPFNSDGVKAKINLFYENETMPGKINEISFESDGNHSFVKINSNPLKKAIDLYGEFKYVVFIPDNLNLIKGYPDTRRLYLDNIAIMQNKAHRKFLSEYKEALKQRCAAYYNKQHYDAQMMNVWDDILTKQGINLTYGRLKFFNLIRESATKIYKELSGNENLDMLYQSDVFGDIIQLDGNQKEKLYSLYMDCLVKSVCDGQPGKTAGAHRDDILFTINGNNARNYASQGQLRSIAISLKLAEAEIIRGFNRENPVILLDEVLGELDEKRRGYIISRFVDSQVFITTCNKNDLLEKDRFLTESNAVNIKMWDVNNGLFTLG